MSNFLQWLHARPIAVWAAILTYTLVVSYPHVMVQDWLVKVIGANGFPAFYLGMAITAVATASIASWFYWRALSNHVARRELIIGWAVTLALSLTAWRFLSVNNSELIHFGQYALPGLVLIALTRSVTDSMAWIVIMAGIDEGYQFWGLHSDWGIPWDFNDIVMDLLGGTLGILFGLGFLNVLRRRLSARRPGPGVRALASIYGVGVILWMFGLLLIYKDTLNTRYWFALSRLPPKGFWFFDVTWGPRTIHSLTPIEGPILIVLILAAFFVFDRRFEVQDS